MKKEEVMLLDISDKVMKEKNYDMQVGVLANFTGYIDAEKECRVIPKVDFLDSMKKTLKLTKYKSKIIIETFLELGILTEDKDNYYLSPRKTSFLKLLVPTAKYCLDALSPLSFKVYCFLLNKYNINQFYKHQTNYFFSKKEILESLGYSDSGKNYTMISEILATLSKIGLISYNTELVGRPGSHGLYHELYSVNQIAEPMVEARKDKEVLAFNQGKDLWCLE